MRFERILQKVMLNYYERMNLSLLINHLMI
nr:MAG TPA: hypothetical protein [Caudoviricetes sp.]